MEIYHDISIQHIFQHSKKEGTTENVPHIRRPYGEA